MCSQGEGSLSAPMTKAWLGGTGSAEPSELSGRRPQRPAGRKTLGNCSRPGGGLRLSDDPLAECSRGAVAGYRRATGPRRSRAHLAASSGPRVDLREGPAVTKAQRERVRRHAAMVAIAPSTTSPIDTEADRLQGLRQWRGDEGEGAYSGRCHHRAIRRTLNYRRFARNTE